MRRRTFIALVASSATLPVTAWAQPARVRRIGILLAFEESDLRAKRWLLRFSQGLGELGWAEGRNIHMDVRWARDVDRMRALAQELVSLQPDVILGFGTPITAALQQATKTIPIVFAIVSDPVGDGFVASLSHPGGNITGFHNSESSIGGKWLELLVEIAPSVKRVAMIFNPDTAPGHGRYYMPDFETAARSLKVDAISAPVHSIADLEASIVSLKREPRGGFIAMADFFLFNHRSLMIDVATRNHVPAVYPWREVPAAGGLASYGPDLEDIVHRAAPYVDRILRGEDPAGLPVQMPTKFETIVNQKAASALGLDIPTSLLLRADEVIE